MTAFADTFALIAWLNPRDNAHACVTAYLDAFAGRLVTTEWVLVELADALSAPTARSTAVAFLQAVARIRYLKSLVMTWPCTEPGSTCSLPGQTKAGILQTVSRSQR